MAARDAQTVRSVYCEKTDRIIPLDGDFCRSCSEHVTEGDPGHREVTPEILRRMGYISTPLPRNEHRAGGGGSADAVLYKAQVGPTWLASLDGQEFVPFGRE